MRYQKLFIGVLVLGLLMAPLYIGLEDSGIIDGSETAFVRLSYLFIPAIVFGLAGLFLNKRWADDPRRLLLLSFLYALFGLVLLFNFYGIVWPLL